MDPIFEMTSAIEYVILTKFCESKFTDIYTL